MADELPPLPPQQGVDRLNEFSARLRVSEQRYSDLRKKVLFVEQNVISNQRNASSMIKSLQDELNDVKRDIQDIRDNMLKVVKELRLAARKEDIDVMKRYLDLWDPVKFCTVDQVERMIDEKLNRAPVVEKYIETKSPVFEEEEVEEPVHEDVEDVEREESEEQEPGEPEIEEQSSPDLDSIDFESLVRKHGR